MDVAKQWEQRLGNGCRGTLPSNSTPQIGKEGTCYCIQKALANCLVVHTLDI